MAHRTALHEDDRVMPVFSGDRCRQSRDIARLRSAGDKLKACSGQVMSLINDKMAVIGNDIVNFALANQALDQRHVDHTGGLALSGANAADPLRVDLQNGPNALIPLAMEFTTVNQNQSNAAT